MEECSIHCYYMSGSSITTIYFCCINEGTSKFETISIPGITETIFFIYFVKKWMKNVNNKSRGVYFLEKPPPPRKIAEFEKVMILGKSIKRTKIMVKDLLITIN